MHAPDPDAAETTRSPSDQSRRSFLRTVGVGALAGVATAGGAGTASAQDEQDDGPTLHGIADYTFDVLPARYPSDAEPTVEFGDDAVVVEGTFVDQQLQPRTCGPVAVSELFVNETTGRLGVRLRHDGEYVAPTAHCNWGHQEYRLEIVPEGDVPDVVEVSERWYEGSQFVEHRDGPPLSLPDGVADYELDVGDPAEPPALERDPSVSFGDGEIFVEGTHDVDEPNCHTVDVVGVEYLDDAAEHLTVELDQAYEFLVRPDEQCPEDRTPLPYELTLTLSDGLPQRFTLADEHAMGQRTTVDRSGPPTLSDAVEDLSFVVGDHPTPDYLGDEVADVVRVGDGELLVEGALKAGIYGPVPGVTALRTSESDATASGDDDGDVESPAVLSRVAVDVGEGGWAERAQRRFCPLESRCYHPYRLRLRFADGVPDSILLDVDYGHTTASEEIDPAEAGPPTIDGTAPQAAGDDLRYRDVSGDGSLGQTDVVRFFETQHRDVVSDFPEYYDFTGDGTVGHGDVVDLFEYVATR